MFTRRNKHSDNIINWNYKGVVAKRCNGHNIIVSDDGTSSSYASSRKKIHFFLNILAIGLYIILHIVLAARSENEEKSEDSENDDNAYATYRAFYRGKN
ncbi:hypothetical protein RIR_jg19258.t1 [Rhizophagus irregularis DAOM 181602=DAOM 197198]|nr:hypothetical protein RIR_jg19258.t1 [Rhizophagus irregularis DAOM 181602=DAOM 197198]